MKFILPLILAISVSPLSAQQMVGQSHKQVLEYLQQTVPADQINDSGDLVRIGETTFYSFNKNVCTEYSIILDSTTAVKRRDELNADKQLHYDDKKNEWINDSKNLVWTLTKNEEEYLLSCKKL